MVTVKGAGDTAQGDVLLTGVNLGLAWLLVGVTVAVYGAAIAAHLAGPATRHPAGPRAYRWIRALIRASGVGFVLTGLLLVFGHGRLALLASDAALVVVLGMIWLVARSARR